MYEIEKNIPIVDRQGRKILYPFRQLEIGDSFFIPALGRDVSKIQISVLGASRRHPVKIVTAQEDEGVRVWRVA